jgi:hypothetical protein
MKVTKGPGFKIIEDDPKGHNTVGLVWLETRCTGKCDKPYRMDEYHPEYKRVLDALERGDRSILHCYHK